MELDDILADRQTHTATPAALLHLPGGGADLCEGFKEGFLVIRGNPWAFIDDREGNPTWSLCSIRYSDFHGSVVVAELDGVAQQVTEDVLEAEGVSAYDRRYLAADIGDEVDSFADQLPSVEEKKTETKKKTKNRTEDRIQRQTETKKKRESTRQQEDIK